MPLSHTDRNSSLGRLITRVLLHFEKNSADGLEEPAAKARCGHSLEPQWEEHQDLLTPTVKKTKKPLPHFFKCQTLELIN